MKDQVLAHVDELLVWLAETAKTEIPPFLAEAYRYWIAETALSFLLCTVVVLAAIRVGRAMWPRLDDHEDWPIQVFVFAVISGSISLVFGIVTLFTLTKGLLAPKLFIIERVVGFLK